MPGLHRTVGAFLVLSVTRAWAGDPTGLWWAEGGAAQVDIRSCRAGLCGDLVWLRSPFDENGCPLKDRSNPERKLRARPLLGLRLLEGLQPVDGEPGKWSGGEIYDPTSGSTYRVSVTLEGVDRLRVRGYLGFEILGRTTTWLRVGSENQCHAEVGARAGKS
jgi:uncharacterized protein (DUF2147 family)